MPLMEAMTSPVRMRETGLFETRHTTENRARQKKASGLDDRSRRPPPHTHTHTPTYPPTRTHTHTQTHTQTRTHTHAHTRTYIRMHTRTHTHTHTHTCRKKKKNCSGQHDCMRAPVMHTTLYAACAPHCCFMLYTPYCCYMLYIYRTIVAQLTRFGCRAQSCRWLAPGHASR